MQNVNQARETGHSDESDAPASVGRIEANQAESEELAGRVMAAAADLTQREAAFLTLVGEFDAARASRWWDGIGSTAQWLAWACSIAPVTAREHVRVARALRTLPVIAEAFGRGELSYSKVRTLTRMTGRYKQEKLLRLARAATAAQLARTVSAYRAVSGTHAEREQRTKVSWSDRPDGLVQICAVLLPEDGAAVIAALQDAIDEHREDAKNTCHGTEIAPAGAHTENADGGDADRSAAGGAAAAAAGSGDAAGAGSGDAAGAGSDAADGADSVPGADGDLSQAQLEVARDQAESREDIARRSRVSALIGVFHHWLESRPEDRSGADHTTVVIEVDAAALANSLTPPKNQEITTPTTAATATVGAGASEEASPLTFPATAARAPGASAQAQPTAHRPHGASRASEASAEAPPTTVVPTQTHHQTVEADEPNLSSGASAEAIQPTSAPDTAQPVGASAEAIQPTSAPDTAQPVGASAEAIQPTSAPDTAQPVGASAEAIQALDPANGPQPIPTTSTGTCHVRGHTGLESDTARRLACEAKVHAIIRGLGGEPLAVSRSKRFGTRAQRRALMTRDKHCQFPGCARQRNLKIHHVNHWIDGGTTDLTNPMLLCQFHHTTVHEGHLTISASTGPLRWRFQRPDGSVIVPEVVGLRYEQALPELGDGFGGILPDGPTRDAVIENRQQIIEENRQHRQKVQAQQATLVAAYDDIDSGDDPRARRSFPVGGGAGFILGNCVEVLFDCQLPDPATADDEGEPLDLAA